jgi:hypothetical protein
MQFSYPRSSRGTISSFETRTPSGPRSKRSQCSDQTILAALEDNPFASVPQLSRLIHLPSTTVYARFTQSLGFVARHFRWVPHALSGAQKGERANLSRRLLRMRMLEVERDRAWHDIVTLDESWFYLSTDYEFVWLPRDEKFPKENDTQFMLMIVWNPRGFHLIKVPENGHKFNAGCYIAEILEPLSQWRSIEAAGNERKVSLRADNTRPHTAKLSTRYFNENRMQSVPHPPYPHDLAPSDLYLFGYVKRCLAGFSFEDADQLLAAVKDVLERIEKMNLQAVFLKWMDRFRKCIATNGDYTDDTG